MAARPMNRPSLSILLVEDHPTIARQVAGFLDTWLPRFESETRSYVTIAFGCTGGRHRSVYLAEKLARHFRERDREDVLTHHRELD